MIKQKISHGHSVCVRNSQSPVFKEPSSDGARYAILRKEGAVELPPVWYTTPAAGTVLLAKETTEEYRVRHYISRFLYWRSLHRFSTQTLANLTEVSCGFSESHQENCESIKREKSLGSTSSATTTPRCCERGT
jgi:hypothetical protein